MESHGIQLRNQNAANTAWILLYGILQNATWNTVAALLQHAAWNTPGILLEYCSEYFWNTAWMHTAAYQWCRAVHIVGA